MFLLQEVSEPAAQALVNLSQNSDIANKMVEAGIIKTAMDILYKQDADITQLLVMLLVNLTQLDAGIESLLQVIPLCPGFFVLGRLGRVNGLIQQILVCCSL